MPFPTIQRSWTEVGGPYSSGFHKSTWARSRSAIVRIGGRGGDPSLSTLETGVHGIPIPYPYYTHSVHYKNVANQKLFRTTGWPHSVFPPDYPPVGGLYGPCVYLAGGGPSVNIYLYLEGYNTPGLSGYTNNFGFFQPWPEGSPNLLDDSEVQAYWVGSLANIQGQGSVAMTYDALDADTDTAQNTGFIINPAPLPYPLVTVTI